MKHLSYRPAIDGVRAIAVLAVFIFHLNRHWLNGGFIGVDVFYVISGYLITSIIYGNCKTSCFNLTAFYQRRIARIAPAFFLVALCTIGFAALIYQAQDLQQAGASLLSASLSMLNISLMRGGSEYFSISPDAAPFTHYWSLSVEEQYYLIFPVLFWFLFRFFRRHLILALGLICAVSFVGCVYLTSHHHAYAFYLLPTRAWELGSGGILAVLAIDNKFTPDAFDHRWVPAFGFIVLVASLFMIRDNLWFPGWVAAFPVMGTLALLQSAPKGGNLVESILSHPFMVYVGKRSYSLYLWHWPIFAFVDYTLFTQPSWMRCLLKIGASFILSEASYRVVENPLRIFLNREVNRRLAYLCLGGALCVTIPIGLHYKHRYYVDATTSDMARGGLFYPGDHAKITVMLMGDSNGAMYGNALKRLCEELNYNLVVTAVGAHDTLPVSSEPQNPLWNESLAAVRKYQPDCVVIANYWVDKLKSDPGCLRIALHEIAPHTRHIILLTQPPILPNNAIRQAFRDGITLPFKENSQARLAREKINDFIRNFASEKITVINTEKHFLDRDESIRLFDGKGRLNYYDAGHLSVEGTVCICQDMRSIFAALAEKPQAAASACLLARPVALL